MARDRGREGYVRHSDGSWVPTKAKVEELVRKAVEGDPEYLATLIEMSRDEKTGDWTPVDKTR